VAFNILRFVTPVLVALILLTGLKIINIGYGFSDIKDSQVFLAVFAFNNMRFAVNWKNF
jgi:hypothetical protein